MAYTTINKHTDYFNTITYTGDGTSDRRITSGFATDFVWIKNRNTTDDHVIFDKLRGGTQYIYTNLAQAEAVYSSLDVTFESDGIDVGSYNTINKNSSGIVSWHWKANGAGSSNTDGTITSTVSANTTAGFSIVSYTGNGTSGATVGHGLGAVPKMMIVKSRTTGQSWQVYHHTTGNDKTAELNVTNAPFNTTNRWNSTTPTSSVFTLGNSTTVNENGTNYIAYIFTEKKGYSKFGVYKGNGSSDGTFVYTGFAPSFVLYKGKSGTGTADNWEMLDNKRTDGALGNPKNEVLYPNLAIAEGVNTTDRMDLLSNGFKIRTNGSDYNNSSADYLYMAFGQSLVGSNNVPCTAR